MLVGVERLRIGPAARRLGVHNTTLRRWADEGLIPFVRVGDERRFALSDLDAYVTARSGVTQERVEALYVRVSGSSGQETSLAAQEAELRGSAVGEVHKVYRDRASGLRENRPGLTKLLADAAQGKFSVVRVTHEDRLARFGVGWLRALLERDAVTVEVLHSKGSAGGMDELLADFMALVATFAGRLYGIRGREAKQRLLVEAEARVNTGD